VGEVVGEGGAAGVEEAAEVVGVVGVLRGRTSPRSSPRSSRTRELLTQLYWNASASWRQKEGETSSLSAMSGVINAI